MTEKELTAAAERLEAIHQQFANMVMTLIEVFDKMKDYLEKYATSFEANLNSYHATTEMLHSYGDTLRQMMAGMEAVVKIAGESNLAIAETNQQMKQMMSKFDSYFGDTGGLEHTN